MQNDATNPALPINRRQAILVAATAVAGASAGLLDVSAQSNAAFSLPALPYSADALEPHIDAATMQIHHGKHHQAYVNNLNKAVASAPGLAGKSIESILRTLDQVPEAIRTAVRNNGGGHANHSLFWTALKKNSGGKPVGKLAGAMEQDLGGFAKFQEKFSEAATRVFGSGWGWLSLNSEHKLIVESSPNQDSPISKGHQPLLGIDVWEHAYYLKYQNRRPDYIAACYQVIDWEVVNARFEKAMG